MDWYGFDQNRSERALQTELLAPALRNLDARWRLLRELPKFSRDESDSAFCMHFVWVLRDSFYFDRESVVKTHGWADFILRWISILDLPEWANHPDFWRHPTGYKGDPEYVVHPVQKGLGWTNEGLRIRYSKLSPGIPIEEAAPVLTKARRVLNTECDCFIQTNQRLIVMECKDKTSFNTEQRERQGHLFQCLIRLLKRPIDLVYIEVAALHEKSPADLTISWQDVEYSINGVKFAGSDGDK